MFRRALLLYAALLVFGAALPAEARKRRGRIPKDPEISRQAEARIPLESAEAPGVVNGGDCTPFFKGDWEPVAKGVKVFGGVELCRNGAKKVSVALSSDFELSGTVVEDVKICGTFWQGDREHCLSIATLKQPKGEQTYWLKRDPFFEISCVRIFDTDLVQVAAEAKIKKDN